MKGSRFELTDFFVKLEVDTFSSAGKEKSYHHILYDKDNPLVNEYDMTFDQVAMKEEGMCYTMKMPQELGKAGIATVSFHMVSEKVYRMTRNQDHWSRGWYVLLHKEGQLYSKKSLR